MIDLNWVDEILTKYIRPQTPPVAVKLCTSSDQLPERVRMPKRDLKSTVPLCMAIAMARRYGWVMAMGKEDQSCPFGALTMGFVAPTKAYLNGTAYALSTPEAAKKTAQSLSRLEAGKYSHMLVAPLTRTSFEPDLIVVYGNPAQVGRLIQATLLKRGGALVSPSVGGIACSSVIARTVRDDECQYVAVGAGDRIFALTQDHEMIFTIPMSKLELTLSSLEEGHKKGEARYPTISYLRFEPRLPETFYRLMENLEKGD